jgi:hypothetical protein
MLAMICSGGSGASATLPLTLSPTLSPPLALNLSPSTSRPQPLALNLSPPPSPSRPPSHPPSTPLPPLRLRRAPPGGGSRIPPTTPPRHAPSDAGPNAALACSGPRRTISLVLYLRERGAGDVIRVVRETAVVAVVAAVVVGWGVEVWVRGSGHQSPRLIAPSMPQSVSLYLNASAGGEGALCSSRHRGGSCAQVSEDAVLILQVALVGTSLPHGEGAGSTREGDRAAGDWPEPHRGDQPHGVAATLLRRGVLLEESLPMILRRSSAAVCRPRSVRRVRS